MRLTRRWLPAGALLGVPLVILITLRHNPHLDLAWFSAKGHLAVITAIASCALFVAVVAAITAVRTSKVSVLWLGVGCGMVGTAMLGHGVTTPGVFGQPSNLWVGRLAYAAIVGLASCLFGAGTRRTNRLNRWAARHKRLALWGPLLVWTGLVAVVSVDPTALSGTKRFPHEESVLDVAAAVGAVALLVVVVRHWRRWHFGHDIMQFAIVSAAAMCIAALAAFEHGIFGRVSWWGYHFYLLAGFGGAVFAVIYEGRREHAICGVLEKTFEDDPFDLIATNYPEALRTMVRAVELKDAYTHGHSERTARLATELGLRMRLSPERLRVIARGAFLHDVGKIGIPDRILNKPGPLNEEERRIIETHPRLGYEIASTARSVREALPVILHHHERIDGLGYPAGLCGDAIPIEARVVTVADVWDALTSRRSYRDAMPSDKALAHILAGADVYFDRAVVDALEALLRDDGVSAAREGEAVTAWDAGQSCHEIDAELEPVRA